MRVLAPSADSSAVFDRSSGQTLLLAGPVAALANLLASDGSVTFEQAAAVLMLDQDSLASLVDELESFGIVDS